MTRGDLRRKFIVKMASFLDVNPVFAAKDAWDHKHFLEVAVSATIGLHPNMLTERQKACVVRNYANIMDFDLRRLPEFKDESNNER